MPIYEYRCEPCDSRFESFVMSSSEHVSCPACQGEVQKLMSTFASVVPGGYKAANMGASAPAESSAPKAGGHVHGGGCGC